MLKSLKFLNSSNIFNQRIRFFFLICVDFYKFTFLMKVFNNPIFVFIPAGQDSQLLPRGSPRRPLLSGHHLQSGLAGGGHHGLGGSPVPLRGRRQLHVRDVSALEQ